MNALPSASFRPSHILGRISRLGSITGKRREIYAGLLADAVEGIEADAREEHSAGIQNWVYTS
jgi:hypothetical protein